jgi:hypothetical protein
MHICYAKSAAQIGEVIQTLDDAPEGIHATVARSNAD